MKGHVDDLATLSDLDDQIILQEIRRRYERNVIYTYIGDILLSVNPYKDLPLYGEQIGNDYASIKVFSDMPPHIYAMATKAYRALMRSGVNQCLLVSGESGAGKTESAKMMVAQLVRISKSSISDLVEQIKDINPLLEAFGNAQTIMNDNSSRFGKLIEIKFLNTGIVIGGKVTEHMLEKSRLVHTSDRERTFHIFYSMIAGLSDYEKRRYFLTERPESYRLIDPGNGTPVFTSNDDFGRYKEMMEDIRHTMKTVGFSDQDKDMILAIMAGLLHLCNIEFVQEPEGQVIILNEDEIDADPISATTPKLLDYFYETLQKLQRSACNKSNVLTFHSGTFVDLLVTMSFCLQNLDLWSKSSALLLLQPEDLVTKLLANTAWIRGERIVKFKSVAEACDGRDALAKTIYSRIFSWMIQQINLLLHVEYDRRYPVGVISILDMAGFENFPVNSFEQLCINVANEQLQSYFNHHVFTIEMMSYEEEAIKPPKLKFTNNQDILDLFLMRPGGIFSLLEDDCRLSTSIDISFVEKMNRNFSKHAHYKKCKSRDPVFTILHYAGQVTYRAEGFIEKNRDTLGTNFQSLMENSQNRLLTELFTTQLTETGTLKKGDTVHRNQWNTPEWQLPDRPPMEPGETLSRRAGKKLQQRMQNNQYEDTKTPTPTTASAYFRNSLSKLLKKMSKGEAHFIRCLKPNSNQHPRQFDEKLVMNQLLSTGVLETTKIRKLGFPTRMPFEEFIHRYSIIAFYCPVQRQDIGQQLCHHILKLAKMKGGQIGKSKVFLKYNQTDQLDSIVDDKLSKIITVQKWVRRFLVRKWYKRQNQIRREQHQKLAEFCMTLTRQCEGVFNMLMTTNDHDFQKFSRKVEGRRAGRQNRSEDIEEYPDYDEPILSPVSGYRGGGLNRESVFSPVIPRNLSGKEYLYQSQVNAVMQKLPEIPSDAWCKIIYMEYSKPVAKFYIMDKDVIIDGSFETFEGEKIGLGAFRNPDKDPKTEEIRSYIGRGILLRHEEGGDIVVKRLSKNDFTVRDYDQPQNYCFSEEVLELQGAIPNSHFLKVFDMNQLHSHIGLAIESKQTTDADQLLKDEPELGQRCVTGISLILDHEDIEQTPCWLLIINIEAVRALKDQEVVDHVIQKITQLKLRTDEEVEKEELTNDLLHRHKGKEWSKLKHRGDIKKAAPLRKTRIEMRQKGIEVDELHLPYSWDQSKQKKKQKTFSELQEELDHIEGDNDDDELVSMIGGYRSSRKHGDTGSIASSMAYDKAPARKDWAKIKATIREEVEEDT